MPKALVRKIPRRARLASILDPPSNPELMQDLLHELTWVFLDIAKEFLTSRKEQGRILRRTLKSSRRPQQSRILMRNIQAVGDLLTTWRRDKRYTQSDGSPRVLPIYGSGATLESLARKFAPNMSINEVVKTICAQAEATVTRDNKVALMGAAVILHPKTMEVTLATLISRIRHIADTVIYNAAIPEGVRGMGRFERTVSGQLTEKQLKKYAQVVVPRLQDVCEYVEAGLKTRAGRTRKSGGVGIYFYIED